jgi:fucose permease
MKPPKRAGKFPNNDRTLLIFSFVLFLIYGFVVMSRASFLDRMLQDLQLTNSHGALVVFVEMLAAGIAALVYGALTRVITKRRLLQAGLIGYIIAINLYSLSHSLTWTLITGCMVGFTANIFYAVCNALVMTSRGGESTKAMNQLHIFFGMGALLCPLYASFILSVLDWRYVYIFASVLPLIMLFLTFVILPKHNTLDSLSRSRSHARNNFHSIVTESRGLFQHSRFPLFMVAIFFYTGTDAPYMTWLVGYLEHIWNNDIFYSRIGLSGWLVWLMIGRWLASLLYRHIKEGMMFLGLFIGVLGMLISILTPYMIFVYLGIWLNGFAFSFLYPTLVSLSTRRSQRNRDIQLALMFASATAGAILFSTTMGVLNDILGKQFGIWQPIITGIIGSLLVGKIWWHFHKRKTP